MRRSRTERRSWSHPPLAALAAVVLASCAPPTGSVQGVVTLAGLDDSHGVDVMVSGPVARATRTDVTGEWFIGQLPPGAYAVTVSAPDTREGAIVSAVVVREGDGTATEPLSLTPVGRITGTVTAQGQPKAGVSVMVVGGAGAAHTEADGSFTIEGVPVGGRDVLAWAPTFTEARKNGLTVRRGEATAAGTLVLRPAADTTGVSSVGTLRGGCSMPGVGPASGVEVSVDGTELRTTTSATGAWVLTQVPNGIVSVSFRLGELWARLPRVLVSPGSEGFIVDSGLFELSRQVVRLRRGSKVLVLGSSVSEISPAAAPGWAEVMFSQRSVGGQVGAGLLDVAGTYHPLSTLPPVTSRFGTPKFQLNDGQLSFWYAVVDDSLSRTLLYRTAVPQLTTVLVADVPHIYGVGFAPCRNGTAIFVNNSLRVQADEATAPVTVATGIYPSYYGPLYAMAPDCTVVTVTNTNQLHRYHLDGTLIDRYDIPGRPEGVTLSADGSTAAIAYSSPAVVNFTTHTVLPLPSAMTGAFISPDGTMAWSSSGLFDVASATFTPLTGIQAIRWLPSGRVLVIGGTPSTVRLFGPSTQVVTLPVEGPTLELGLTRDGTRLRMLAEPDPVSGLYRALELSLVDGGRTVLAEEVSLGRLINFESGIIVHRPRPVGRDTRSVFVPVDRTQPEVPLGRQVLSYSLSPSGERVTGIRYAPDNGHEEFVWDSVTRATTPVSLSPAGSRWLDERHTLSTSTFQPPFSADNGSYLVEVP